MSTSTMTSRWKAWNPVRWPGPLFGKELRGSSRRRRFYWLRVGYLLLLAIFVIGVWYEGTGPAYRYQNGTIGRQAMMSEVGKIVTVTIVWFQYCAMQLVAIILMSTAISEEINHRTLHVLMSTPVTSRQIVFGKLLAGLWQLLVLLALSLPLLALVQVFGGVQWEFVLAGACTTLTAVLIAGSVAIWMSTHIRTPGGVILATLAALGIVQGLGAVLVIYIIEETANHGAGVEQAIRVLGVFVPWLTMFLETLAVIEPHWGNPAGYWPIHCLVMLGAAGALLAWTARSVRRRGLALACGETRSPAKAAQIARAEQAKGTGAASLRYGRIRRVRGNPLFWLEGRTPMLARGVVPVVLMILLGLGLLVIYGIAADEHALDDDDFHVCMVLVYLNMGALVVASLVSTGVPSDREAGTLEVLLAGPVKIRHLLLAKAWSALRRTSLIWGVLMAHIALFAIAGILHPVLLVQMALVILQVVAVLAGIGTWVGVRVRRSTPAVVLTLLLAGVLWGALPGGYAVLVEEGLEEIGYEERQSYLAPVSGQPDVQALVVTEGSCRDRYDYYGGAAQRVGAATRYRWPHGRATLAGTLSLQLFWTAAALGLSALLFTNAAQYLRKHPVR